MFGEGTLKSREPPEDQHTPSIALRPGAFHSFPHDPRAVILHAGLDPRFRVGLHGQAAGWMRRQCSRSTPLARLELCIATHPPVNTSPFEYLYVP